MTRCVMALALLMILNGCVGPQFLKVQRYKYNEAIQESTAEQLLLNIVRLRYNDSPMFLNVGDIDARFTLESSSTASGNHKRERRSGPTQRKLGYGNSYEQVLKQPEHQTEANAGC